MSTENRRYHAYLLRLWQVKAQGHLVWCASLEDAHSSKRLGFAGTEALFRYLRQETEELSAVTESVEEDETCGLI
ncbi:MAG: hypothetical protein R3C14_07620 [Caldilineaceae bacterium]